MANVNALAAGLWSAPGTWTGGVPPGPGDVVHANNKAITIDQNITVGSLNTTLLAGGAAGGSFTLNSGFTVNANVNAGLTHGLICAAAAGTFIVNGNIIGSITTSSQFGISHTSVGGTLTVTGNVQGGTVGGASYGINSQAATGTLNVIGNLTGGSTAPAVVIGNGTTCTITGTLGGSGGGPGLTHASSALCTINGDVTGSTGSNGVNMAGGSGPMVINGNVVGGSTSGQAGGVGVDRAGTLTVNGNVTGGSGTTKHGIFIDTGATSSSVVNVNGDVHGGSGSACRGIHSVEVTDSHTITVTGGCYSSSTNVAVDATGVETILVCSGPFVSSGDRQPVCLQRVRVPRTTAAENYFDFWDPVAAALARYSAPDAITDLPDVEDVRDGVVFAGSDVGTLAVPLPSQVSAGIATDDTVGTAVLLPEDVWDFLRSAAVTSGSMGERLKNAATVSSTGDQIAAAA